VNSMDELVRHCQTKGTETDMLKPKLLRQFSTLPLTDGLLPTVDAVLNKLDEPMPMMSCNPSLLI